MGQGSQNDLPRIDEIEGPFAGAADSFADFDYAQPPLAEIQILRVLENHINRKKKDQLEKARRFRDQLLKHRNDAKKNKASAQEDHIDRHL